MKETGFKAMGLNVPPNRMNNAFNLIKNMLPNLDNKTIYSIVSKCAEYIKMNNCFGILGYSENIDEEISIIKFSGRQKLLRTLLKD